MAAATGKPEEYIGTYAYMYVCTVRVMESFRYQYYASGSAEIFDACLYCVFFLLAVCINDKADVIFAGTSEPTALGCMYSIGAIAKESNGAIQKAVTDLLEVVDEGRIYINFFDVPRANVGWSRKTFAGQ